ncbi:MAG: type II toxin-antitoxin system Phd/YefM family antitoxin [Candidatus Rickettsia vulgarisii]
MKKWSLQEAKKNLEKIMKNVLHGEIQGIMDANGEVVYLVPGEKYPVDTISTEVDTRLMVSAQ